jgi:hypothetical protein
LRRSPATRDPGTADATGSVTPDRESIFVQSSTEPSCSPCARRACPRQKRCDPFATRFFGSPAVAAAVAADGFQRVVHLTKASGHARSIGSAMSVTYPYHSLEDFLTANMLTVDAQLDDGWGASFPVKGREIEATVLFADVTAFSARTADLDPTETLTFVNNFFCWITSEALRGRPGRAATSAET